MKVTPKYPISSNATGSHLSQNGLRRKNSLTISRSSDSDIVSLTPQVTVRCIARTVATLDRTHSAPAWTHCACVLVPSLAKAPAPKPDFRPAKFDDSASRKTGLPQDTRATGLRHRSARPCHRSIPPARLRHPPAAEFRCALCAPNVRLIGSGGRNDFVGLLHGYYDTGPQP